MQNTVMTINLRKRLIRLHTARRRKRAVGILREEAARFSKSDPSRVKIDRQLSEFIEKNASGASFLWARLKVSVEKSDGKVEIKPYAPKVESAVSAPKTETREKKAEEKDKQQKKA